MASGTRTTRSAADMCPMMRWFSGEGSMGVPDNAIFYLGEDTNGVDFRLFGNTTGSDFLWDASGDNLAIDTFMGTLSGEEHGVDLDVTGTLASGTSMVGLDVKVTSAGTAGSWVSALFCNVTQGSTKNVNGYLCAGEFELTTSCANVSDWFVIVLNAVNNGANQGSHSSYIALRDYGSLDIASLFWISTDFTAGSDDDAVLWGSLSGDTTATHAIRFIAGSTPYWILCSSAHG